MRERSPRSRADCFRGSPATLESTIGRRRSSPQPSLEFPSWLRELIAAEDSDFDEARAVARLAGAGVHALGFVGEADSIEGISFEMGIPGWVDVLYEEWERPISTALQELISLVTKIDLWRRLLIAMTDFELIADAARELAAAREQEIYSSTHAVLEVGLVSMYARSFTGAARIADKWRPTDPAERELHDWLMDQRHRVHAHADRSEQREVVTTSDEGVPFLAEKRRPILTETLRAIAEMCDGQYQRLWIETGNLKISIGIPATI